MAPKNTAAATTETTAETAAPKTNAPRIAPEITSVSKDIPIPAGSEKKGPGRGSLYPFDTLTEKGMSFGVTNKTQKGMASIVSNQNRKNMVAKKDAEGNTVYKTKKVTDENGVENTVTTDEPEMVFTVKYHSADVDSKTDPDGAKVRVWRVQ